MLNSNIPPPTSMQFYPQQVYSQPIPQMVQNQLQTIPQTIPSP